MKTTIPSVRTLSVDELLALLRESSGDELTHYSKILKETFKRVDPVFTKQRYADFCLHCASTIPESVTDFIVSGVTKESLSARGLLALWKVTKGKKAIEDAILRHARDESRHSHLFMELISLACPASKSKSELEAIRGTLTKIRKTDLVKKRESIPDNVLLDHLIQMNMGEIKSLILTYFFSPAILARTPKKNREKVRKILDVLDREEVGHIADSAKLINDWCAGNSQKFAWDLYRDRLVDFEKYSVSQTEATIRAYGQTQFLKGLQA